MIHEYADSPPASTHAGWGGGPAVAGGGMEPADMGEGTAGHHWCSPQRALNTLLAVGDVLARRFAYAELVATLPRQDVALVDHECGRVVPASELDVVPPLTAGRSPAGVGAVRDRRRPQPPEPPPAPRNGGGVVITLSPLEAPHHHAARKALIEARHAARSRAAAAAADASTAAEAAAWLALDADVGRLRTGHTAQVRARVEDAAVAAAGVSLAGHLDPFVAARLAYEHLVRGAA